MNNPHQNARTTRLGRAEMIRRIIEDGQPVREVARGFGISERTARKWLARYRAEGPSGLDNRSSRPRTVANRTGEYWIGVMEMLRREYRLTAEEIAGKLKLARSTVAAWLTRRGLGRLAALEPKEPPRRYQRQHPGELIHLDIKKLARFERVGAPLWADQVRAELRRIGGRAPSRGELTEAERRITALVAEGRTNREVAAALFVSEHTVEGALTRAYRKLGVRSRTELSQRLGRKT